MVAWWLLLIGGLNWGLVGLLNLDLVAMLLGAGSLLSRVVYVLVGVSALAMLAKDKCKMCMADKGEMKKPEAPKPMGGAPMGGPR
jgi:uncharacterized membrane protein YuzA (DUF378 family)